MNPVGEQDYAKPVAYDEQGRPLYAHPPQYDNATARVDGTPMDASGAPQVVYMTRAIDPHQQPISPEVRQKHDESARQYPHLNLSDGEYVISAVRRHPIGVISIWLVVSLAILIVMAIPAIIVATNALPFNLSPGAILSGATVLILAAVLVVLSGVVATMVYNANRFYLTNESVTQYIQTGLFSKKNQTISLGNIEDASYSQKGIIQTIFNYGSLRLSTEGEETTYRFAFVADPQKQTQLLNDAVEAFKNFRPLSEQ